MIDTARATTHALPPVVISPPWVESEVSPAGVCSEQFVHDARLASSRLPAEMRDVLDAFVTAPPQAGAILFKGLPVGAVPATPPAPTAPTGKDATSEFTLLTVAARLGEPVGYLPEHGGDVVQNIVPTRGSEARQVSTSSRSALLFHTEAAFHPHRPRYLLLLCLRGDTAAHTTLSSIFETMRHLSRHVVETLFQPRFRTAVDESYLGGRSNSLGAPMSVLSGDRERPTMVFDADLMVGTDAEADMALQVLGHEIAERHTSVSLEAGDLLVVDNSVAVHGRSPFTPRFDGTDRWLQRTFVVDDLAASAAERTGRVITTRFGA